MNLSYLRMCTQVTRITYGTSPMQTTHETEATYACVSKVAYVTVDLKSLQVVL